MHCLLCHEKIPRIRYWRTKSEFCCDEHAALHRRQTMERLVGRFGSIDDNPEVAAQSFDARVEARLAPRLPADAFETDGGEALVKLDELAKPGQGESQEESDEEVPSLTGLEDSSAAFEDGLEDENEEEAPLYRAEAVQRDEPFPIEIRALQSQDRDEPEPSGAAGF